MAYNGIQQARSGSRTSSQRRSGVTLLKLKSSTPIKLRDSVAGLCIVLLQLSRQSTVELQGVQGQEQEGCGGMICSTFACFAVSGRWHLRSDP